MDLYDSILKRKSIRHYRQEPIDTEVINAIRKFITEQNHLYINIETTIEIIEAQNLTQYFISQIPIKAPYYLAITSQKEHGFGENVGYLGEQIIAFLNSIGMGTCWLGTLRENESSFQLPFIIAIAFGYPDETLYRDNLNKIQRLPVEKICIQPPQNDFMKEVVQVVRIAPSGINRQPWRLEPDSSMLHLYCEHPSFLTPVNGNKIKGLMPGAILKKMQGIDCGIALAHILIYSIHHGQKANFKRLDEYEFKHKKLTYIMSAIL